MTRTRKKKKNKKRIVIFMIFFLLLTCFLLREKKEMFGIEKIGRDIILSIQNFWIGDDKDVEDIDTIKSITLKKEELEKEIIELKEMLELKYTLSDSVIVTANVVNRNLGYFYDTVTINKGKSDGIEEGMAVVAKDGLIGKTVNVSYNFSDVQLLTGEKMDSVSVKIKSRDSYAYGLLVSYDAKKNIYRIEGISETMDVLVGEEVTTTGYGNIFPSGIIIGTVINITTDQFDLAKIIEATPSTNVYDFSVVSVLKRNVNS